MSKPTVFFSHSSKDKEMILSIKKKLDELTGGTLDIFMSSDGQSIPFGRNWIYKIEEGLNKAAIMFVFITPNSITSNWIYFESGFAYSKEIRVIPVGIGIDISLLNAPLSLLQGFNINSYESLNNIISIINEKFGYHFEETFKEAQYNSIILSNKAANNINLDFSEICDSIQFDLSSIYIDDDKNQIKYDIKNIFKTILDYLNKNSINYSFEINNSEKHILVYGIKIYYLENGISDRDKIKITISPYNFEKSFQLFNKLIELNEIKSGVILFLYINDKYDCITQHENLASLISSFPEIFSLSINKVGSFIYKNKDIYFSLYSAASSKRILKITYNYYNIESNDILKFIYELLDKHIIYLNDL